MVHDLMEQRWQIYDKHYHNNTGAGGTSLFCFVRNLDWQDYYLDLCSYDDFQILVAMRTSH